MPRLLLTPSDIDPSAQTILDLRPAEAYAVSRIPGAVHLDLWGVSLIDTSEAPLRAFMWMVGHLFSLRGVTPERTVVVYDHDSGIRAARAWWLLEHLGHPAARILDGGVGAWLASGRALTTEIATPVASAWHGSPDASTIATWRDVRDRLGSPATAIVDTRSDAEHYAEVARARRAGAIPGAVHVEWKRNLDETGRFKSPGVLRAMYEAAGVRPDQEVITYCQGGYRAAHGMAALRLAGYTNVRNYTGSWKEWGDREDLPIEIRRPRNS